MIPFLPPGNALTAANWTAVFQAADALATTALGGLSAVLAGVDKQFDRGFFFFDPTNLPAGLHPVAIKFLASASYGPPNQPSMFYRLYSDTTIATAVAACTVGTTSTKFGVVKLTMPTWSAWSGTVYPSGFGSHSTTGLYSGTTPALNILDVSLSVVTVSVSGVSYAATFTDVTMADHVQPFKPVDIFINAAFTWAWNKYTLVRIHNCSTTGRLVTFGSVSQTLAPGASLCARKLTTGWIFCGNYFHWMESGDPRFLYCPEATGGGASLTTPGIVADVLQAVLSNANAAGDTNYGGYFDASQFWSLAAIYNTSSYTPDRWENTPPSGGYLPGLSMSALLGDLIVHKGKFLVANRVSSPTRTQISFTGFGALASTLTAAGVSNRTLTQTIPTGQGGGTVTNLEIYWNTSGAQDLIDLSTPLVTFITGNPASTIGSTQTSSPKSLALPWLQFYAVALASNPTTTNLTFYNWKQVNGAPAESTLATVSVTTAGSTASVAAKVLLPTNTPNDVWTWLTSTAAAGGILTVSNPLLLSTTFGPVLSWQETWPLDARFNGLTALSNAPISKVAYQYGIGLIVTRTRFLGDGFNLWPPRVASATFMLWNFARVDQKISFNRFFLHATADAPMMPNWSPAQGSTNYSWQKYCIYTYLAPYYSTNPFQDTLSTGEFWAVQSFYESAPISADAVLSPAVQDVPGLARTGPFATAGNLWPVFANWFNSLGNFSYNLPPDEGGTATINVATTNVPGTDWYQANSGNIIPTAAGAPGLYDAAPAWRNVLMCQAEQFNTLASLLNGEPPMKYLQGPAGNANYTLSFPATSILIVNGGTGYAVNDTLSLNLKVSAIGTGGVVTAVAQNGSVVTNTYSALATPLRPFAVTGGHGTGLTIDTSSGSGSALTFLPTYAPIGVQIPVNGSGQPWPGVSGTIWPRTAWFSWNGPTAGGADPVGTYLAGLGMTVQTTLPDNYGAEVAEVDGNLLNGSFTTTTPGGSYIQGFTGAFQITAQTYRWVTINDARTLYSRWSVPFVLNEVLQPLAFNVIQGQFNSTFVATGNAVVTLEVASENTETSAGMTGGFWATGTPPGAYYSAPLPRAPNTANTLGTVANDYTVGQVNAMSFGNVVICGFSNNAAGNWVTLPSNRLLSNHALTTNLFPDGAVSTNINGSASPSTAPGTVISGAFFNGVWNGTWASCVLGSYAGTGWQETVNYYTYPQQQGFAYYWLDYGVLNPVVKYPTLTAATSQALVILREGLPNLLAAVLPQNCSYYDPNFISNNYTAYQALGSGIVPIIADNTVEASQAEINIIPGAGGPGQYDHPITTGLLNGRLFTIPLDAVIGSPAVSGAGNANTITNVTSGAGGGGL